MLRQEVSEDVLAVMQQSGAEMAVALAQAVWVVAATQEVSHRFEVRDHLSVCCVPPAHHFGEAVLFVTDVRGSGDGVQEGLGIWAAVTGLMECCEVVACGCAVLAAVGNQQA